jgi:hypothetical protein
MTVADLWAVPAIVSLLLVLLALRLDRKSTKPDDQAGEGDQ